MSRIILHKGNRFTVVVGSDHILKSFIQVYDNTQINNTPEGEGLVFDWSIALGLEVNKTTINVSKPKAIMRLIEDYINSQSPKENLNLNEKNLN